MTELLKSCIKGLKPCAPREFTRTRFGGLRAHSFTVKKTGTIEALNVSPKGFYEGFLLHTGKKIVQVNLPKHELGMLDGGLETGKQITAEVEAEEPHGEPKYVVFRLLRLAAEGDDKHGTGPFVGRIERLNYALHGAVNGGILESGDFLHLKPGERAP